MSHFRLSFFLSVALLSRLSGVCRSQGLMGGFKGHHHRGTGAVELLLATGILAKLLNHRAKFGPSYAGRHILHALIGGHRYPPRYSTPHASFPMGGAGGLLSADDVVGEGAAASMFHDDLSPFLSGQESGMNLFSAAKIPDAAMQLAEVQLQQQLMAARRARKILEARKILAAQQEAKQNLALVAAQSQIYQDAFLQAAPSRQVLTAAHPPTRMLPMQMSPMLPQMSQMSPMLPQVGPMSHQGGQDHVMMGSEKNIASRSDPPLFTLPAGLSDQETAQIIASLAHRAL